MFWNKDKQTSQDMILEQLKQSDRNQIRIFDKLDEQNKILGELTTTVTIHQKYSENLEKEQKDQRATLSKHDDQLAEVHDKIQEVNIWIKILRPTKMKVAAGVMLVSLLGGNEVLKLPEVKSFIKECLTVSGPLKAGPQKSDTTSQ